MGVRWEPSVLLLPCLCGLEGDSDRAREAAKKRPGDDEDVS